ncbi:MAG: peptidase domain-containing ABC transporter [Saprospiraceae bacterium]
MQLDKFPYYRQLDAMDCGATCLRMIARYHGRFYSLEYLRDITYLDREGVSLMSISDAAEHIGLQTLGVKVAFERLADDLPLPCVAHWRQQHFVVVYKISSSHVWLADPAAGKFKITKDEFIDAWASDVVEGEKQGIALLFEKTPDFGSRDGYKVQKTGFSFLFSYLSNYRPMIFQIILGLIFGSLISLVFPFLLQSIVDTGIPTRDLNFIYVILVAQVVLTFGHIAIDFLRGWILLHIGSRVNIRLVSDFLIKLMRLPIKFFDTRLTGDLMQRIQDNQRIEHFLTSSTLSTLFSIVNFVIFGAILAFYNTRIFVVFAIATALYLIWILFFLRRRKILDYRRFDQMSKNQSSLIQIINGMSEIKIHNAETQKRWEWERIQAQLYRLSMDYLSVDQFQHAGASLINELKNVIISVFAAKAVIDGQMTLGQMMSMQYIIGQLNGPVEQFIGFVLEAQSALISLERMNEIHSREDEENLDEKLNYIPENQSLILENVSFNYGGPHAPMVLSHVDLVIPKGKKTAIVGSSGSGKTTLLKLLLNSYPPLEGQIRLGDIPLRNLRNKAWRDKCGVVMQEGFIFSDSIAKNIALGDETIDKKKLLFAARVAQIHTFIDTLPLGYNTKIGEDGIGLSQGQKQRMLIARAVYKNPDYLFLDEATNSLDAYNELLVMENLEQFFKDKTVVVVAHRLSTVKNADNIVVIERGEIVEQGTHEQLTASRGTYYHLVKNQLELGN